MANPIWFWQDIVSPHMAGLAAALAARGLDVTYVAEQPMSAERATQGWMTPDLGCARLRFASDACGLNALVADAPADSIHICQGLRANGIVGAAQSLLAARGLRQWVVMETVDDSGLKGALKRLAYRRLIYRWRFDIEGILATGHATPAWLAARGMPEEYVFPFAYFLPVAERPHTQEWRSDEPIRILFAGQLIERKRLDVLIEALAQLGRPGVELIVIGSGRLEHELRALAKARLGDRTIWLGVRPQPEIPRIMAQADCLVLPSNYDGWGAVVSEALMVGTPAICSDRCGAAGVVRASGCGGVFPADDAPALAAMLEAVIARGQQNASRRAALAAWARCLGAEDGADYLLSILRYRESGHERPLPPWESGRAHAYGAV